MRAAGKSAASSLEEKLDRMQEHIVEENVQKWAEAHGTDVPDALRAKEHDGESLKHMYMGGADKAQLSAAIFQQYVLRPDMIRSPERRLLNRFLDGIGPMRVMGQKVGQVVGFQMNENLRDRCIHRMSAYVAQQGEEIMTKGQQNNTIWILVSGAAELMVPPRMAKLVDGKSEKKGKEKVTVRLMSVRNIPMGNTNGVKTQPNPVVFFRLHDSTQKSSRKVSCQNPIFQEDFSMFYDSLDDVLTVTLSDEDQEGLGTVLGTASVEFARKFTEAKNCIRKTVHLNKADGTTLLGDDAQIGAESQTVVTIELKRVTSRVVTKASKGRSRAVTQAICTGSPYESPRNGTQKASSTGIGGSRSGRSGRREATARKPQPPQQRREILEPSGTMAEQLVGVLKYAPGDFFGEFEAISLSGSRAVPAGGEPLGEYLTTGGIATATIRAAERCELLRISTAADVRLFHTCLNSSTLKLLDQLCTVGQYASVEEDALARLAVFGRERWMKRGEVVFVDGASPEYVVMVLQGQLKALATPEGAQRSSTFQILFPGSVVGEAEVVAGVPYRYTMVTQTDCQLLYIHRFTYLENVPPEVTKIIATFAPHLTSGDAEAMGAAYVKLKGISSYSSGKTRMVGAFRKSMALQTKAHATWTGDAAEESVARSTLEKANALERRSSKKAMAR